MSPRLTHQRGFEHRAAYHFRLTDTDCDGRICFEEFLFAYCQARDAERCSSMGALDTGCSMNERPGVPFVSNSSFNSLGRRKPPMR